MIFLVIFRPISHIRLKKQTATSSLARLAESKPFPQGADSARGVSLPLNELARQEE